jgi:hypothetical protein
MVMKKTSGGDSPLRQGAGKSFWTLLIFGSTVQRIAMCSGKLIGYLGFFRRGVFIDEGASSEVDRGSLTCRGRGQGLGRAALVCGPLVAPLRLLLDLWKLSGKIRLQELVLSNSENISCVSLLKHKNNRKQVTGTVATC